jgi:hypothetical protein
MSRASGRKNPTRQPRPGTPEGDEIGLSERQDPAGWINADTGNIVNYETVRQPVESPPPMDEFRGVMAHGVPHEEHSTEERAQAERGGPNDVQRPSPPQHHQPREIPPAVPVFIVEEAGGPRVYRSASPRHLTVANNVNDATRLGGRNPKRNRIGLLNEDATTDVRFAVTPRDLNSGGGALLPHAQTSYFWFETQDELYANTVSATLTVTVSIIEEFDQAI